MAGKLTYYEKCLIKTMCQLGFPRTDQAILSYFSKPGRDLDHRIIAQIRNDPDVFELDPFDAWRFIDDLEQQYWFENYYHVERWPRRTNSPTFKLRWHAVGQGLFFTGELLRASTTPFIWSYDCGTLSGDPLLDTAISQFRNERVQAHLDLAVLSHFDKDHISGFVRLVEGTPVSVILLPYMPLALRLLAALSQGIRLDSPLLDFFLDPTTFLRERASSARIVYVVGGTPDTPISPFPPDDPEPDGSSVDRSTPPSPLRIDTMSTPEEAKSDPAATHGAVTFLQPGGRLTIPGLWEFVPYNDAALVHKATSVFTAKIAPLVAILEQGSRGAKDVTAAKALDAIRRTYDATFGNSSIRRNVISLFMYSGPTSPRPARSLITSPIAAMANPEIRTRFSQMHTGDGYLDDVKFPAFQQFYMPFGRLERAGLFQVMHHGAKPNWHKGLANKLKPVVSIFSSDPGRATHYHPHAEVLRDFWSHTPIQVDKKRSLTVYGVLS